MQLGYVVILSEAKNPCFREDTCESLIYIMSNRYKTLYVGVTNDLERRVYEHKNGLTPGFTKRYNINQLVLVEETSDVNEAITREKQLKGWVRRRKIELIEAANPRWDDLAAEWYGDS